MTVGWAPAVRPCSQSAPVRAPAVCCSNNVDVTGRPLRPRPADRCHRQTSYTRTPTASASPHSTLSSLSVLNEVIITFRVSRRRRETYCGHPRRCVCLSAAVRPHNCTDPDVAWGSGRRCPLVVHYWADLQSGHGLHCYGNITRTRNVSKYMLVLVLCLV